MVMSAEVFSLITSKVSVIEERKDIRPAGVPLFVGGDPVDRQPILVFWDVKVGDASLYTQKRAFGSAGTPRRLRGPTND